MLDGAKAVRAGEELELPALGRWLSTQGLDPSDLSVEQFPKGHSNLTYLVHAGGREFVLRRPPRGSKVKSAHDMSREVRILRQLALPRSLALPESRFLPQAPRIVASCDDPGVLGVPFYLMERLRGVILRGPAPRAVEISPDQKRALDGAFIDQLAALHTLDWQAAGLGDLGHPEGYVRRQVEGWTRRWHGSKTDEIPEVDEIAAWLFARIPPEGGAALIHNDYKFDNLVLDPGLGKVVGILDWEMATIGDPLMDLGTALGYWVEQGDAEALRSFAFGPTFLPGSLSRRQLVERYSQALGRDVGDMLFYYCFALFKTAVVAQQIYARFKAGLTTDERFSSFIVGVQLLSAQAVRAAQSGQY